MVGCWFSEAVRFGCLYLDSVVGGFSVGETPGPIPNPEAKPFSADGTALGRVWESRTLPAFNLIVGGWFVAMDIAGTTPHFFASTPGFGAGASRRVCPKPLTNSRDDGRDPFVHAQRPGLSTAQERPLALAQTAGEAGSSRQWPVGTQRKRDSK